MSTKNNYYVGLSNRDNMIGIYKGLTEYRIDKHTSIHPLCKFKTSNINKALSLTKILVDNKLDDRDRNKINIDDVANAIRVHRLNELFPIRDILYYTNMRLDNNNIPWNINMIYNRMN